MIITSLRAWKLTLLFRIHNLNEYRPNLDEDGVSYLVRQEEQPLPDKTANTEEL